MWGEARNSYILDPDENSISQTRKMLLPHLFSSTIFPLLSNYIYISNSATLKILPLYHQHDIINLSSISTLFMIFPGKERSGLSLESAFDFLLTNTWRAHWLHFALTPNNRSALEGVKKARFLGHHENINHEFGKSKGTREILQSCAKNSQPGRSSYNFYSTLY